MSLQLVSAVSSHNIIIIVTCCRNPNTSLNIFRVALHTLHLTDSRDIKVHLQTFELEGHIWKSASPHALCDWKDGKTFSSKYWPSSIDCFRALCHLFCFCLGQIEADWVVVDIFWNTEVSIFGLAISPKSCWTDIIVPTGKWRKPLCLQTNVNSVRLDSCE